jgi:hypothetical protein
MEVILYERIPIISAVHFTIERTLIPDFIKHPDKDVISSLTGLDLTYRMSIELLSSGI